MKQEILSGLVKEVRQTENGISQRELARRTGYSRPTVRKYIRQLVENGRVERVEIGGMYLYTASDKVKAHA